VFSLHTYTQIGKSLGLQSTLEWVYDLNLGPIDFELDSKLVLDCLIQINKMLTKSEIIIHCTRLFTLYFYNNFSIEFIMIKQIRLILDQQRQPYIHFFNLDIDIYEVSTGVGDD
jgi:hypothetical protein